MMKMQFVKSMLLGLVATTVLGAAPAAANPVMLFDINSGAIIEHQDAFKRWHPASLTKLMTAYTTFRAVRAGNWRSIRRSRSPRRRRPSRRPRWATSPARC
ncbi:hypothetical protein [Aminobacter anthyllidis]|uniref:hypothetical protein n=1 Tax=Aminobacter anthyllidis TaxID=1035067 RepID=UPI00313D6712